MINKIFFNLFTDEEYLFIKSLIDKEIGIRQIVEDTDIGDGDNSNFEKISSISRHHGRITLRSLKIPSNIIESVHKQVIASAESKKIGYSYEGAIFVEYNLKYGFPNLGKHLDNCKNNILVDYQLYSNVSWPILVKDKEYVLLDNSCLPILVCSQEHSRPRINFKEGDVVGMIFFNFQAYDRKAAE
jgi:hypothetical protein